MAFLGGLFEGPATQIPAPNTWTANPNDMEQASQRALGGISNLGQFNTAGQTLGQYGNITQNLVNNPYASQFIGGAQQGAGMGQQAAMNQFGQGGNLYNMAGSIAQTGFDPQQALYGRTQQQLQDQTRAGLGARGLAMTPWGAGVENKAMSDFNIDWQNQQLNRQIQAGQAAGGLVGQGAGLQGQAGGLYGFSSGMPYNAYQQVGQGQLGALGQYGQQGQAASAIPQQGIQDYLNYIGQGNQSGAVANQTFANQINASKVGSQQQSDMWGGIGKLAGSVAPYAMMAFSDIRVKDDVVPVGELYDRTPVYSFRYKGDPVPRIGLMAQDVEIDRPEAVAEIGGVKVVDYGRATARSRALASGAGAFSRW